VRLAICLIRSVWLPEENLPQFGKRLQRRSISKGIAVARRPNSRKLMTDNLNQSDIIIIDKNQDDQNLDYIDYLKEMKKYKAALSLPGGTEICNRDIECFGIGVPVIRPSLQINFEDPLRPNYHYISFYQPCDYTPMGYPSYQSYEDFKKNLQAEFKKRNAPKFVKATDVYLKTLKCSDVYIRYMKEDDEFYYPGMQGLFKKGTNKLLRRHQTYLFLRNLVCPMQPKVVSR
jgi:hypothetical protein